MSQSKPKVTNKFFVAGTPDEKVRAFEKHTGRLLWEYKLPVASYATPSTFMLEGAVIPKRICLPLICRTSMRMFPLITIDSFFLRDNTNMFFSMDGGLMKSGVAEVQLHRASRMPFPWPVGSIARALTSPVPLAEESSRDGGFPRWPLPARVANAVCHGRYTGV